MQQVKAVCKYALKQQGETEKYKETRVYKLQSSSLLLLGALGLKAR